MDSSLTIAHDETTCGFCRIVFKTALTGRRPRFCSSNCRQAANREEHCQVNVSPWRRLQRRRDLRARAELERLKTAIDPTSAFRYNLIREAAEKARQLARDAWPDSEVSSL